ncbi:MAG: pyrroline-5-carboxylate reductase, partial [Actinobacteria bacterium]
MQARMRPGRTAVIGGGRMGTAIAAGLAEVGFGGDDGLVVAEPDAARRALLEAEYRIRCVEDAAEAVRDAATVVLAVKPQVMDGVAASLADALAPGALVVSIAAGIPTARIEALLPAGTPVVRVMPNTPAMVYEGMSVVSAGARATREHLEQVIELFGVLGTAIVVPESLQDAATAVSGSGPAYFARFAGALAAAGEANGLAPDVALELAVRTMLGTAELLLAGHTTPAELV